MWGKYVSYTKGKIKSKVQLNLIQRLHFEKGISPEINVILKTYTSLENVYFIKQSLVGLQNGLFSDL